MNHYLIQNKFLLTGQNAPFTGQFVSIAKSREACFHVYSSGEGSIFLQYKSPFFENQGVDFYSFTNLKTGHSSPAKLDTPLESVRAVASGNGRFWVAATLQN